MGDRAAFIITLNPTFSNRESMESFLSTNAVDNSWITPWVSVGCLKQSHPDFYESYRELEKELDGTSSLTIVDEKGSTVWSNCKKHIDTRFEE